jgi:hypothetical protein
VIKHFKSIIISISTEAQIHTMSLTNTDGELTHAIVPPFGVMSMAFFAKVVAVSSSYQN